MDHSSQNKHSILFHAIWVLFFIAAITFPLLSGLYTWQIKQKSNLSVKTPINYKNITNTCEDFQIYFTDNFGFRTKFIRWYNYLWVQEFGISPLSKVIVGNNRWLYYNGEKNENVIDKNYRNTNPLTQPELIALTNSFEQRRIELLKKNIHFVLIITPDKESIYPEFLPKFINKVNKQGRVDQLVNYLHQHSHITIIDCRDSLLAAKTKSDTLLYYKGDTHWNNVGAYVAYNQIIEVLKDWFPNLNAIPLTNYKVIQFNYIGDLARMLQLPDLFIETAPKLIPKETQQTIEIFRKDYSPTLMEKDFVTISNNPKLPSVYVLRDSFMTALQPYLTQNFNRAHYIWRYDINLKVIEAEHPDLLIEEMVERDI